MENYKLAYMLTHFGEDVVSQLTFSTHIIRKKYWTAILYWVLNPTSFMEELLLIIQLFPMPSLGYLAYDALLSLLPISSEKLASRPKLHMWKLTSWMRRMEKTHEEENKNGVKHWRHKKKLYKARRLGATGNVEHFGEQREKHFYARCKTSIKNS